MVEPPSAMYVQSRGSVIDIGVLASDEETGTGGATVCCGCDSSGLGSPGFRGMV